MTTFSLIILLLFCMNLFYWFLRWKHRYWQRRGIFQVEPDFLFGNFKRAFLGKVTSCQEIKDAYNRIKKANVTHGGMYYTYTPVWIPTDLTIIKNILYQDFNFFTSHGFFYKHKNDILTNHLFSMENGEWRTLRAKLSPAFSSGKLKLMFYVLRQIGDNLEKKVEELWINHETLDVNEINECFSNDVVFNCFYGLNINTIEDPKNEFRKYGVKIFHRHFLVDLMEQCFNWNFLNFCGHSIVGRDTTKFFVDIVRHVIDKRTKNNIIRHDIFNQLLKLYNSKEAEFTLNDFAANVFLMAIAGFDTISATISFLLYEVARNQDVQSKMRDEIRMIYKNIIDNRITYDGLQEMKYCEMVINEVFRLHSVATEIPRQCTQDYKIPETNMVIEKGTLLFIPSWAIHTDPDYYPNPNQFDPERFNEENKRNRPDMTFLPFSEGPRICIGSRFAQIAIKIAIIKYLKNFKLELNEKTPREMTYKSNTITMVPNIPIILDISKID
ncbi:hypothetical protein ABEB36_004868 [Hypothenemus hampei]|uniref:Cytochrome P450 n=1 Tax=Hypothenemus hampei TaxID=57062 RepID=A0ABD1EZ72_HYPHA